MSRQTWGFIMMGVLAFKLFSLEQNHLATASVFDRETHARIQSFEAQYSEIESTGNNYAALHQLRSAVSDSLIHSDADELHLLLGRILLSEARALQPQYPHRRGQQHKSTPLLNAAYSEFSLLLDTRSPLAGRAAYYRFQVCPQCEDSDLVLSCKLGYTPACRDLAQVPPQP